MKLRNDGPGSPSLRMIPRIQSKCLYQSTVSIQKSMSDVNTLCMLRLYYIYTMQIRILYVDTICRNCTCKLCTCYSRFIVYVYNAYTCANTYVVVVSWSWETDSWETLSSWGHVFWVSWNHRKTMGKWWLNGILWDVPSVNLTLFKNWWFNWIS